MNPLAAEALPDLGGAGCVQPDADLRRESVLLAVVGESALDGDGARDRRVGAVEADEEAVPVVPTSSPECAAKAERSVSSCQRSSSSQASSPIASARFVDFTMSVNMKVFRTRRSGPAFPRSCQGRSSSTSSISIASVGHDIAACSEELLLDAVRVDDVRLQQVSLQPVEGRRARW